MPVPLPEEPTEATEPVAPASSIEALKAKHLQELKVKYAAHPVEYYAPMAVVLEKMPKYQRRDWVWCDGASLLNELMVDYYVSNGFLLELYDAETDTDELENTRLERQGKDTFFVRVLGVKLPDDTEVRYHEYHKSSVARAFAMFGVLASEEARKKEALELTRNAYGIHANREPKTAADFVECLRAISTDHFVQAAKSRSYAYTVASAPNDVCCEKLLYDLYRSHNQDMLVAPLCARISTYHVSEVPATNRKVGGNDFERHSGFAGGVSVFGIAGNGYAYMYGKYNPKEKRPHLFVTDVGGLERPVVPLLQLDPSEVKEAESGGTKAADTTPYKPDMNRIKPCWRCLNPKIPAPYEAFRLAVSAQRGYVGIAACVGTTTVTNAHSIACQSLSLYLYATDARFEAEPSVLECALDPENRRHPTLPSFVVVSTRLVVAVMADSLDPVTRKPLLHMFAREFDAKDSNKLEWKSDWEAFLILPPVMPPNEPVPKAFEDKVEAGKLSRLITGAFDAHDPMELTIGTYDGVLLPYRFYHDNDGLLSCASRGVAPYLSPTYLDELKVNCARLDMLEAESKRSRAELQECRARLKDPRGCIAEEKSILDKRIKELEKKRVITPDDRRTFLETVGRLRCPVTCISTSFGTHGGVDRSDSWWGVPITTGSDSKEDPRAFNWRCASRVLCGYSQGIAWQFGDRSTAEAVQARQLAPAYARYGSAVICIANCGSVVALHVGKGNELVIINAANGEIMGSFTEDPAKGARDCNILYTSLWMDLGRIVMLMPDGELIYIVHATPEELAKRSELIEKEQSKQRHAAEMGVDELSAAAAQLSISDSVIQAASAGVAASDTLMSDQKLVS
jgi:hypothetical protein